MTRSSPPQNERIAAIDVGSNSLHLVIGDLLEGGQFDVIDREKEMVKLGSGVQRTGIISARAWREGLETMQRFAALIDSMNVGTILGVATSACREADNGAAFLEAVEQCTGLRVRLISGKEEGRLIHAAVGRAIEIGDGDHLLIDIGGGSVELVASHGREMTDVLSVNLGVQRLLDTVGHSDALSSDERDELRGLVDRDAGRFLRKMSGKKGLVVGTSGTIEALGVASRKLAGHKPWRHVNAEKVTLAELEALSHALCKMTVDEREKKLDVEARRADAIHLGCVVLVRILELAGRDTLTLCDASLREGVVAATVDRRRRNDDPLPVQRTVRERAVQQLATNFGATLFACQRVATIATMLFDGLKAKHQLKEKNRQTLMDAATLHDIGRYVHRKKRHKHGRYVIEHARLRGFSQRETDMLKMVVRYHRRSFPKKKHKRFKRLPKRDRKIVTILAGILRVALAFDRRHAGKMARVDVSLGGDEAVLLCEGDDIALELHAARRQAALLERALGVDVVIRQRGEL